MTRCRMRVKITMVTAKTCQTDEQPTRAYTRTNSKDDISNKLTLMYNCYNNIERLHMTSQPRLSTILVHNQILPFTDEMVNCAVRCS